MSARTLAIVPALLLLVARSFAWSGTGHMVIAAVAERDLKASVRSEVARLLGTSDGSFSTTLWQAATWADENRSPASAPWHYINFHFRTDGKRTSNLPEKENVVVAIERFSKVLADRTKPHPERKEALLYLLHFVGDVHQPLHAVARDTDEHPSGDRGGNEFEIVSPSGAYTLERPARNLHSLWDAGAGIFANEPTPLSESSQRRIRTQADTLRGILSRRQFPQIRERNPQNWAKESLREARRVVYALQEKTEPSPAYLAGAHGLAAKRATLAGYRLADLLNRLLGG